MNAATIFFQTKCIAVSQNFNRDSLLNLVESSIDYLQYIGGAKTKAQAIK